ncbi:d0f57733-ab46-40c0-8c61-3aeabe8df25c [Thermothielavioides terrestris]|uniref:D0f57733-ab46-40c0-8c61-3aeabe8df25c n=1 Tax=Thermothielavioides terrestris TaxID=2587410 RepID=A0A446BA44_9PEZI|nr:d0f57733-ab46-40c0-8c61-3aeabe8df25c [Thermothielavioides terrestris]
MGVAEQVVDAFVTDFEFADDMEIGPMEDSALWCVLVKV